MSETRAVYTFTSGSTDATIDGRTVPMTPAVLLDSHTIDVQYMDGGRLKPLPYPLDEPEAAAAVDTAAIRSLFAEALRDASHDYYKAWTQYDDAAHYRKKVQKDWDEYERRMVARLDALLKGEG